MTTLRLISAPAVEPVSLATAKAFLRIDSTADDVLITSMLRSAREVAETLTRRALITQTLEMTVDNWPPFTKSGYVFDLLRPPLQSIVSMIYRDWYGNQYSWTNYLVDIHSEPGHLILHVLPGVFLADVGAISIQYIAGYGDTADKVPERIKTAILLLLSHWYELRDIGDVPEGVRNMFLSERVVWFNLNLPSPISPFLETK